jgi:hypothetical protein
MSFRTLTLIDVPKQGVSKRKQLDILKREFGIETWHTPGLECPWIAVHLPSARRIGKPYGVAPGANCCECMMKVGRLMDEAGATSYGTTEREAIRELCQNVGIPLEL